MKKILSACCLMLAVACEPLATCEDSEFPELCGSDVCDQLRDCCEANADNSGVAETCGELSDGLAEVPEAVRQPARDETCKQALEQSGVCE
jgi:hypothetical protein